MKYDHDHNSNNTNFEDLVQIKKRRCEKIDEILESTPENQEVKHLQNLIKNMNQKKAKLELKICDMPIALEKKKLIDEINHMQNAAKWLEIYKKKESILFFSTSYDDFDRLYQEVSKIGLCIHKMKEEHFVIPDTYDYQFECLKASMTLDICGNCKVMYDPEPNDWNIWYDNLEIHLYNENDEKIKNMIQEKYYFVGDGITKDEKNFICYCEKIFHFDLMDINPEWSGNHSCTQCKTIDLCDDSYLCAIKIKTKE